MKNRMKSLFKNSSLGRIFISDDEKIIKELNVSELGFWHFAFVTLVIIFAVWFLLAMVIIGITIFK